MKKKSLMVIIFLLFLTYTCFAGTYKDTMHGFSFELPDGWQKQPDSPMAYYITFYGPKDTAGFVPTFVIAVADKQQDFKAFVDTSVNEAKKSTKDYALISKKCPKTNQCTVLATYSFDPKSIMVGSKNKALGKLPIKSMQIFIGGNKKFYILTAGSFTKHFAAYIKTFTSMINSFKEDQTAPPKKEDKKSSKKELLDEYFKK